MFEPSTIAINNDELLWLKRRYDSRSHELYIVKSSLSLQNLSESLTRISHSAFTGLVSVKLYDNLFSFVMGIAQPDLLKAMRLHGILRTKLEGDWTIQFGQYRLKENDWTIGRAVRTVEIIGHIESYSEFTKLFNSAVYKLY